AKSKTARAVAAANRLTQSMISSILRIPPLRPCTFGQSLFDFMHLDPPRSPSRSPSMQKRQRTGRTKTLARLTERVSDREAFGVRPVLWRFSMAGVLRPTVLIVASVAAPRSSRFPIPELFRRRAGRLLERHTKTVCALVAAHAGEHLDFVVRVAQQL